MTHRSVLIEADGGSRGNPGPAAYGAVLKDAETGEVIAEEGTTIGVATNNVAEYSGLIAGLRLAEQYAPDAEVEVRMDSKLVVEQMSGRWKIKHPDMKPLAMEASRLAPFGTTYTWVPRERNRHADRLANEALDGTRSGVTVVGENPGADSLIEELESPAEAPRRGWAAPAGEPTTVILVRHGVTTHTLEKRFSGGLASANPGLDEEGRAQARAVGAWLAPLASSVGAVVSSPVRRTLETAEIVADLLEQNVEVEHGFAEMEFGAWDGKTFLEVAEQHPDELDAWLGSLDVAPGGGESFRVVEKRVLDGLQRLLDEHGGKTVVVVSHVTPIKTLVAHAVEAPLSAVFRMELSPASVTVLSFFRGGKDGTEDRASLRMYNALPPGNDAFSQGGPW
ncbi:bifunctional RNase H/acid phosphatase [Nocardioides koreensis]|uniref:Bifunctional RNase H/acid phosphatase n=1 Tax=Nocardioides koreensis TaxID=433651 RepID=A0ABN2ZKP7_9ACTN